MTRRTRNLITILTAAILMLACAPTFAPAFTPIPTYDPNTINLAIAGTANAAGTQTQMYITPTSTSTPTVTPTKTPSITPSPTNTFIYILYTYTPTKTVTPTPRIAKADYACELISQTPPDKTVMTAGNSFQVRWQVKNTGKALWDKDNVDFRYKTGAQMHSESAFDLSRDVASDGTLDLIINMSSPTKAGDYSTTWTLRAGKQEFCKLTLFITVK